MPKEPLEPKEIEVEQYSEEDYDDMLDEQGDIVIGSLHYSPSQVLKEVDPIAYRVGLADIQEYETRYKCPICDEEHEDEDDAKWCCQNESDFEEDEDIDEDEDELEMMAPDGSGD